LQRGTIKFSKMEVFRTTDIAKAWQARSLEKEKISTLAVYCTGQ
jgi:hypothetical protein